MMMGFQEKKCIKALKSCDMNVERAMDWIFSHMDDPDDDVEDSEMEHEESGVDVNAQYECNKPGIYGLQSFITHLGASVHAGHYVCHIKKVESEDNNEPAWIYFNDAKVARTTDPPIGKGYMYFLTKK